MSKVLKSMLGAYLLLALVGCQDLEYVDGYVNINNVGFVETYRNQFLNLPSGTTVPIDNPNFDFNNPATWTGSIAQYVNKNYMYSVSYTIENVGGTTAYDTELDLHYIDDKGAETVQTIYVGDIKPSVTVTASTSVFLTNKQLVRCNAEVYWNNY